MEIKKVKRMERKDVPISVRTTKKFSEFMRQNDISPSKVFNEAVNELYLKTNKN